MLIWDTRESLYEKQPFFQKKDWVLFSEDCEHEQKWCLHENKLQYPRMQNRIHENTPQAFNHESIQT